MKTPRTVSVPEELWEKVDAAVDRGEHATVSAAVTAAIAEMFGSGTLEELLAEWDAELGPPSAEARAWAERMLADDGD